MLLALSCVAGVAAAPERSPQSYALASRYQQLWQPADEARAGEELELGIDAALFGNRIAAELTFYDKRTRDAPMASGGTAVDRLHG